MDISDVALLRRWQRSSDSEAFAEIVARHSAMVFATCNRILRNNADAEDVAQECFMELGGIRTLMGNSLGGLLHTLATHRSLDRLKGESRRREREIRYAMGRPTTCAVRWDDIHPHIDAAIANLPVKYRDAVIRHFLEGQTHAEIAGALGIADSTVRYRIKKGIEGVRKELHRRGVIVSSDGMGTALDGSRAETISARLGANLGKLSMAGPGNGVPSASTVVLAGAAIVMKKALGIVLLVGVAGLLFWGLKMNHTAPEPHIVQNTPVPLVAPSETEEQDSTVIIATGKGPIDPEPVAVASVDGQGMEEPGVMPQESPDVAQGDIPPMTVPGTPNSDSAPFAVAKNMEAINIALPEAFFGGTPLDYWGPNLEPEDYKDRPPFLAPVGTALISAGKPATASSKPTLGTLRQLTDGDKDYAKTSLVELPEGLQWVQVDLEETSDIYAVIVWKFHEGKRVYFDLVVLLSDDPEFRTGVTTIYNNDFDNSAGLGVGEDKEYIESNKGRLIDAMGARGRYVRVYGKGSTANDFNHFIEVEVWGRQASTR